MRSRIAHGLAFGTATLLAWLAPVPGRAQGPELTDRPDAGANRDADGVTTGPGPAVVPPRLLEDPGVSYPAGALAERFYERAEVALVLELDDTGKVVSASVETPQGHGFDEAALEAANRMRFEPAARDGVAARARIRYRYAFEPPASALAGRVLAASSGDPVGGARLVLRTAAGERVITTAGDGTFRVEDLTRGHAGLRVEAVGLAAQQTEIELAPADEIFVTFLLLPGQADAIGSNDPSAAEPALEVTVRGERLAPTVSSYTREEVRKIPGAFGDPFRAIETLPGVTPVASGLPFFYLRGAPPGNVGYFLDGVRVPYLYHVGAGPSVVQPAIVDRVDLYPGGYPARYGRFAGGIVAASTTDPRPLSHGEANLRLFDVGGIVETGFGGGRGSALLGGRYSYTAALLSLAAPNLKLDYRDFQARISYDLSADDRLSVFAFGAYDLLKQDGELRFGSEFYRADVRYDHRFERGKIRTAVTLGYDRTNAGVLVPDDPRNVADRSLSARTELESAVGARVLLRAGVMVGADVYRVEGARYVDPDAPEAQQFEQVFPPRTDLLTAAWLELAIDATKRLQLMPGLRADAYGSGSASAFGVDPRLAARFSITPSARIVSALGLAHQLPSFVVPLPGIAPALGAGLQRSVQSAGGVEIDFDPATMLGATFFYHLFFHTTDAFGTAGEGAQDELDLRSRGSAFGAELFLRRRLTKRLGGFASYTLSRSVRKLEDALILSAFDRTHVLNTALSCDLGRGFRAGARFLYYTGTPIWRSSDGVSAPSLRALKSAWRPAHVEREPSFYRLDVRLEKRWRVRRSGWVSLVLEFLNATLHKETWPGGERIGPIAVPNLGLEAGF